MLKCKYCKADIENNFRLMRHAVRNHAKELAKDICDSRYDKKTREGNHD